MLNIVISFKHSTFLLIKFIWNLWLYRVVFLISVNFLLSFYSRDMYPKCFFPYFRLAIFLPHLVLLRNLHGHLEQCIDLGVFCRCVLVWDEWWSWTRCLFTFLYPSAARLRCYATRTYNECVMRTTFGRMECIFFSPSKPRCVLKAVLTLSFTGEIPACFFFNQPS